MVIFLQNLWVTDIAFFCHRRKQNYRIRHSDRTKNTRQREISIEPVSIPEGCHFTYQSRFYSLKVYSKLTMALTIISIGEEELQIHVV